MTFADIPESTFETNDFDRPVFVKIQNGSSLRLRILDKDAFQTYKHYIQKQRVSVICLGEELCPICDNNRRLLQGNDGKKGYQIPGFIYRQNRYLVNVFNRTPVKTSPSGKVVYPVNKEFPTADPDTGEPLIEIGAKPLEQVQVLERGPQLFSQLNLVNDSVVTDTGEPLGLWNYDIALSAIGTGRDMVTNITALSHLNDVLEIDPEDLFEREEVGIRLEPDEVVRLVEGVSLRDIFSARGGESETAVVQQIEAVTPEVKDSIANIFGA